MYRKKRVFSTKDKYVKRRKINIFSASPPPKKKGGNTLIVYSLARMPLVRRALL